jgi:uncharacterized repeat protein (TIGR01451 family)
MSRALLALLRLALLLLAAATTSPAVSAGTLPAVTSTTDTWINENSTAQNNGTATTIRATNTTSTTETRSLIAFTMPTIPSNETITSAVLKVTVTTTGSALVSVNRLTGAWTETGATWTNSNAFFNATAEATFTPSTTGTKSIDVTSLVQGWAANPSTNFGLGLTSASGSTATAIFASAENATTTSRPQLVITTALISPGLLVVKSSSVDSDPVNGTAKPMAVPGAVVRYTISASNTTAGTADANTTVFTDGVPSTMKLRVSDIGAAGSGPVTFTNGATSSGLTYSFVSLASTTDSIAFSKDGGATYTYTPVADASGYDALVTNFKITLTGTFAGKTGATSPSLTMQMLMQVK